MKAAGDRAVSVIRSLQMANVGYSTDHHGKDVPLRTKDENAQRFNDWHQNSIFLAYLTGDESNGLAGKATTTSVPEGILDPIVVRAKKRLWNELLASCSYNEVGMPGGSAGTDKSVLQETNPARTAAFIPATDWIAKYNVRLKSRRTVMATTASPQTPRASMMPVVLLAICSVARCTIRTFPKRRMEGRRAKKEGSFRRKLRSELMTGKGQVLSLGTGHTVVFRR